QVLRTFYPLPTEEQAACRWLMERYDLRMVVLTAGADYSAIYTLEQSSLLPTPAVEQSDKADTVGAGDAFTGTLVASLLRGLPLAKAHQEAIREAAEVCRIRGAWR
ncbi:MAG: carbohydrate kinase, partial [Alistipes sp.]|nr:carbohydrate kinase [Alistipes sp.]